MQIVSSEDNLHEMSKPIFWEKLDKIFRIVICWLTLTSKYSVTSIQQQPLGRHKTGYHREVAVTERLNNGKTALLEIWEIGCYKEVAVVERWLLMEIPLMLLSI